MNTVRCELNASYCEHYFPVRLVSEISEKLGDVNSIDLFMWCSHLRSFTVQRKNTLAPGQKRSHLTYFLNLKDTNGWD